MYTPWRVDADAPLKSAQSGIEADGHVPVLQLEF